MLNIRSVDRCPRCNGKKEMDDGILLEGLESWLPKGIDGGKKGD